MFEVLDCTWRASPASGCASTRWRRTSRWPTGTRLRGGMGAALLY